MNHTTFNQEPDHAFRHPLADGKLAVHFGHCASFALLDVDPEGKSVMIRGCRSAAAPAGPAPALARRNGASIASSPAAWAGGRRALLPNTGSKSSSARRWSTGNTGRKVHGRHLVSGANADLDLSRKEKQWKTVVIGASNNEERYSNKGDEDVAQYGHSRFGRPRSGDGHGLERSPDRRRSPARSISRSRSTSAQTPGRVVRADPGHPSKRVMLQPRHGESDDTRPRPP